MKKKHGKSKRSRRHQRPTAHRPPPGAVPGSWKVDPDSPKPVIRLFCFDDADFIEKQIDSPAEIHQYLGSKRVTWINVDGLGDETMLREIGEIFQLHPLSLADVVNVHQRPKVESYPDHLFLVTRMMVLGQITGSEQVSVFLGESYLLSFQERAGDVFDPIRDRIRHKKGRVRSLGPDYIAYLLLDAVVDGYFPLLDEVSEQLERLEDETILEPSRETVTRIHAVKRDLLTIRRAIWPQREAISSLLRDDSKFISENTKLYLRDAYDHTVQIIDIVETYRELASGLMDVYLSSMSNRMNEIMKVLTIIATIFIPLTFVAGVYGMNFDPDASPWNMPELNWYFGYPLSLLTMALVAIGMLLFFRRRGWIGSGPRRRESRPNGDL